MIGIEQVIRTVEEETKVQNSLMREVMYREIAFVFL
jgi:hypothetical protein